MNKIFKKNYKVKVFCAPIFKMPLAFLLLVIPCFNFWWAENKMKTRKVENMKILFLLYWHIIVTESITLQNCDNIIKENIKC